MIPSHDSPVLFALAIGPAIFLAVLLHEIGHVLVARSVGIDVAAWGVGYRRPRFFRSIGSSVFYLGRPLTGGLMIPIRQKVEREPIKEFIMVLGGPLASVIGLAFGIAGLSTGIQSAVLYAWVYVSAIFVLFSTIPCTFTSKSLRLINDAAQLLHILRRGRESMVVPIGPTLASTQALAELLATIHCERGLSHFYASIASLQSVLGDVASARLSLAAAISQTDRSPYTDLAHASIVVAECSPEGEPVFAAARQHHRGDATAEFAIDCMHEQWRLSRDCSSANDRQQFRQRALDASRRDWLCWIECLIFEAESFEDVESRCRELLKDYCQQLGGVTRARLLALTSERLAATGDSERAKALFEESQKAISFEAASIASDVTREAYLQSAMEPLQRAAKLASIDTPKYDPPLIQCQPYRRRVFAQIALITSLLAFATGAICSDLIFKGVVLKDSGLAMALMLPAVLSAMLALFAGMISILRSETRRWRILSIALPLTLLSLVTIAVALSDK